MKICFDRARQDKRIFQLLIPTYTYTLLQGGKSNGMVESCAKEPLLPSWEINGEPNDVHITKNSQVRIIFISSAGMLSNTAY